MNAIIHIVFATDDIRFSWLIRIFLSSDIRILFILQVRVHNFHWSPSNILLADSRQKCDVVLLLNRRPLFLVIQYYRRYWIDCSFIWVISLNGESSLCPIDTRDYLRWRRSGMVLRLSKMMMGITWWHFYLKGI